MWHCHNWPKFHLRMHLSLSCSSFQSFEEDPHLNLGLLSWCVYNILMNMLLPMLIRLAILFMPYVSICQEHDMFESCLNPFRKLNYNRCGPKTVWHTNLFAGSTVLLSCGRSRPWLIDREVDNIKQRCVWKWCVIVPDMEVSQNGGPQNHPKLVLKPACDETPCII